MVFLFDFDTRTIIKSASKYEALDRYIDKNDLSLAVTVLTSADDIDFELSPDEQTALFNNIAPKGLSSENGLPEVLWSIMSASGFRVSTIVNKVAIEEAPIKTRSAPSIRVKDLRGKSFVWISSKALKPGSAFAVLLEYMSGRASSDFSNMAEYFAKHYTASNPNKKVDVTLGEQYIRDALKAELIRPVEGSSAEDELLDGLFDDDLFDGEL